MKIYMVSLLHRATIKQLNPTVWQPVVSCKRGFTVSKENIYLNAYVRHLKIDILKNVSSNIFAENHFVRNVGCRMLQVFVSLEFHEVCKFFSSAIVKPTSIRNHDVLTW